MTKSSDERKHKREVQKLLDGSKFEHGLRTFEVVQYVSGPLPGKIDDWPPQIQDAIEAALEEKAKQVELPLKIVHSYCAKDVDSVDPQRVWYVHVLASEIVAGAEQRH